MTKFLIATHGYLADGYKSTIGIIMGEEISNKISTLNLFVDDNPEAKDAKSLIDTYFNEMKEDEQVIVFTDIMHGSVNQMIMSHINYENTFALTGINLPLVCELMALYGYVDSKVDEETLRNVTLTAQKETIFVNDLMKEKETESQGTEEDFFD